MPIALSLLKYWKPIAVGLFLLALVSGSYFKGRSDANANCELRINAMIADAQKQKDAEIAKANVAAADLEKDNANANVEDKTREVVVTKIVERPVYRDRCFDTDGLSVANSALTGKGTTPAQPDQPMP